MNKLNWPLKDTCDATIAICTYQRLPTLKRTLKSLESLRGDYSFEVLVVDGPSTDGTREYLNTRDDVRVLSNPEINLSISRNIALANATGRYVAFIDDDAVPEPDWLTLLVDRLDADTGLSALGGFIRDANGISFQDKYVYCDCFGRGYKCESPEYATFLSKEKRLYLSLTGTNSIFRRSDILSIGGFDEVFAYFLDETDVNKRMDDAGMRLGMVPEAEIHHKYAPSHLRTEKKVSKNMYPIARSIAYFALTHGVTEYGWNTASERIKEFFRNEFSWKSDMVRAEVLDAQGFDTLMMQIQRGVLDGIDAAFPEHTEATDVRVGKHHVDGAPAIRRMRSADDTLRLCMLSQDHGHKGPAGIGRWTNLVARGLSELGHEVSVIGHLDGSLPREFVEFTEHGYWSHNLSGFAAAARDEVDCLGLPSTVANASKRKYAEFRRMMPRRQFHLASTPIWDVEGAALISQRDVPNVLSLHTCAGLMLASKPEWREREDYYQNHVLRVISAEIQALKKCDLILANSKAIMTDISDVYGLDLFDRPHAIVPHGIDDITAPDGLLEQRAETAGPVRILFLGRLEKRKGIEDLVNALDVVFAQGADIHVDIVGGEVDAYHRGLVHRLVSEHPGKVVFHGFLDDEALDPLMRSADIFVAPSHYESFGLIYVEAMRYSVPCIGYSVGGVAEVIDHGKDGLLTPLGDVAHLARDIMSLAENSDLRNQLSRGARTSFLEKFHYTKMSRSLEDVYCGIAFGKSATRTMRPHGLQVADA